MKKYDLVSIETILKAIDRDQEALSQIYKAYYKRVYFIAVQFFRNTDIAEDIVQEVFIKVYNQIESLKDPNTFNTWLHTVTYRTCLNHNRRKLKLITLTDYEEIEDFVDLNQQTVEEQVSNELIMDVIMDALEDMNPSLKTIAILRFLEGMKVEEISDIVGIPKGTVGTRLIKIRQILQKALENKGITTKQYGAIILSPAVIHQAYLLLNQKYIINDITSTSILDNVLKAVVVVKQTAFITKIIFVGLSTGLIISGLLFWELFSNQKSEVPMDYIQTIDSPAKIVDITYDDSWTNGVIALNIDTTNDNYDKIYVNGVEFTKVIKNGSYTVQLIKDGNVIDQREITISNIDRDSPYGEGFKQNNQYILYLKDNLSGVDQDSIKYFKNGELSDDYLYDEVNQSIIIENDSISTHNFSIDDYAGNRLNITIK